MEWLMTTAIAGVTAMGLGWPTIAPIPMTQILIEDGSPYYVPVTAIAVSGSLIEWANPTPTHHTVTHSGCLDDSTHCAFDSACCRRAAPIPFPASHLDVTPATAGFIRSCAGS